METGVLPVKFIALFEKDFEQIFTDDFTDVNIRGIL